MPVNEPPTEPALAGVRVAVIAPTGSVTAGIGALGGALRAAGANVTELSLARVEWLDAEPLAHAVSHMDRYEWVLLTSASAVAALAAALRAARTGCGACKLAVVGAAAVDAAEGRGWEVTLVPERVYADGLVDAMAARSDVEGARVLYPAADGVRDVLPSGLRALGATVDVVPVYRSAPDPEARVRLRTLVADGALDLAIVAAPGALDALLEAIPPEHARRLPLACIGPVASRAARRAGFPVKVEADSASAPAFVRRIIAAFRAPL